MNDEKTSLVQIPGDRMSQEKGTAVPKGPEGSWPIWDTKRMPVGESEECGVESRGRHSWGLIGDANIEEIVELYNHYRHLPTLDNHVLHL